MAYVVRVHIGGEIVATYEKDNHTEAVALAAQIEETNHPDVEATIDDGRDRNRLGMFYDECICDEITRPPCPFCRTSEDCTRCGEKKAKHQLYEKANGDPVCDLCLSPERYEVNKLIDYINKGGAHSVQHK